MRSALHVLPRHVPSNFNSRSQTDEHAVGVSIDTTPSSVLEAEIATWREQTAEFHRLQAAVETLTQGNEQLACAGKDDRRRIKHLVEELESSHRIAEPVIARERSLRKEVCDWVARLHRLHQLPLTSSDPGARSAGDAGALRRAQPCASCQDQAPGGRAGVGAV